MSLHSGSDKFAVYPAIKEESHGKFHIKTSGTSWLKSLRLTAKENSSLFREIYDYAMTVFKESKACYHIGTNSEQLKPIDDMSNESLPKLLKDQHSRQMLHITYGGVLNVTDNAGIFLFHSRLKQLLRSHAKGYAKLLEAHMGSTCPCYAEGLKQDKLAKQRLISGAVFSLQYSCPL